MFMHTVSYCDVITIRPRIEDGRAKFRSVHEIYILFITIARDIFV